VIVPKQGSIVYFHAYKGRWPCYSWFLFLQAKVLWAGENPLMFGRSNEGALLSRVLGPTCILAKGSKFINYLFFPIAKRTIGGEELVIKRGREDQKNGNFGKILVQAFGLNEGTFTYFVPLKATLNEIFTRKKNRGGKFSRPIQGFGPGFLGLWEIHFEVWVPCFFRDRICGASSLRFFFVIGFSFSFFCRGLFFGDPRFFFW